MGKRTRMKMRGSRKETRKHVNVSGGNPNNMFLLLSTSIEFSSVCTAGYGQKL